MAELADTYNRVLTASEMGKLSWEKRKEKYDSNYFKSIRQKRKNYKRKAKLPLDNERSL